ncbi:MAG TPA: WG repeat-containing protein, partial [Phycisphaerae bacterium]|nr:WG repeat-containing protein [Phycisphaerae bacterium]
TLLGRSIAPAVDGKIAEGSKFSFANDMHLGPKALRENGRLNEVQGNWRTWWTANKEKALAIYDWPANLRPDSLVGLWILRRTDNPGPTEANIYEMLLNADKTWAEMAVWGDPAKPTKVEVDSQGSDWSLVCDAFGEWHLMRWANAAHSSGASTHIISAKTSEFTLLIGNGIRITQKYERASAPERAAVQPFLAASAVKMEAPPPVPTPLDWPGTPDLSRIAGTWFSDQQSRDATGAEEFVFLTIEKSGPWRLGQFFGSPDAPVRVQTDQQGPDWRLAGSSIYFHRPPLPTGGDAGFTAAVERLTNNEMKLSPRTYQRASPQLTAILLGKPAASSPATTNAVAAHFEVRDLFPICDQTKWGYIDPTGKIAILPAYEDARFFSEGLAAVRRNGKYGYIDKTGKLIIPPQFQYGFDFHEGLAWVDDGSGSGFIDQTGKIVLRAPAGMYCREFHDGLALAQTLQFMDGPQALTNLPHKAGFIDKTGNFAIEPRFDAAMDFAEGLAAVFTNGKWGFIDKTGKLVMAAKYDGAAYFSEGLACVRQGNKTIVIDKLGQQPFPKSFDDAALFKEGLCSVKIGEKWGFIDTAGTLVIPPQFDDGTSFLNGRAPIVIHKKHGYIDKTGHIIIPPTYAYAHFFLGDLAGVSLDPLKSDGSNYIYINARGEVIWQPAATQTTKSAAEDRESAAIKALAEKALAMTPQNSRPVTGHSEQRPTSLDFTTILEATGQAKDFAAFPQDHRFFQDTTQQLAREGKIWALAALLDHENVDAKVYSARGLLACADARSMPALLAAAKANAYVVSGSENATLHMIYRETLKQAMEKITGLKLTPLGLHVTEYPKPNEPRDISSDEHPERFGEDADFQKVERWMTEKFGVKATTATATHGPKDDPALDDPDVAALLTAIKPQAGWKLERKEGTVQPINLEPGHGIELAFPQTKPANPKVIPLTIW